MPIPAAPAGATLRGHAIRPDHTDALRGEARQSLQDPAASANFLLKCKKKRFLRAQKNPTVKSGA